MRIDLGRILRADLVAPLLVLGLGTMACEPTCENTCRKLLDCELSTPRVSLDDCSSACTITEQMYDEWEDTQLQDDFADFKTCVREESCSDIDEGVCYDDGLYPY